MIRIFLFFLALSIGYQAFAQDSVFVLSSDKLSKYGSIVLGDWAGWRFQQGSNPEWANPDFDDSRWQTYTPHSLRIDKIDQQGLALGCFRLKLKVDSSLAKEALNLRIDIYAAVRVFINGKEIKNRRDSNLKNGGFTHKSRSEAYMPQSVFLDPTRINVLVIYTNEQKNNWLRKYTYMDLSSPLFIVIGTNYYASLKAKDLEWGTYTVAICVTGLMLLALVFWLMAWQNPLEKQLFWIALLTTFLTIEQLLFIFSYELSAVMGYPVHRILSQLVYATCVSLIPPVISQIFLRKTVIMTQVFLALGLSLMVFILFFSGAAFLSESKPYLWNIFRFLLIFYLIFLILKHKSQLDRAQWIAGVGLFMAYSIGFSDIYLDDDTNLFIVHFISVITYLTFPFALLIYIALRLKQNWVTIQRNIHEITILSTEKQQLLATQNERLEQQVEARTAELKASQAQLIQKEKLASLGELTAGIAHEIQNPLNFVNNFSEVSAELVTEMQVELDKGDIDEAKFIANDLHQNLQKITHHGQRASSIVKGMLEHSRTSKGEKQLINLNQLADEYLRLAHHGMKAKNKDFEADYKLITDENLLLINVVPQDIGRVFLNLINNAFYAVNQRTKSEEAVGYQPKVIVRTQQKDHHIQLSVQDNGNGIPEAIKDKIFQPFFTTKPTGEGTGLGLSLSYDIIIKGHGGTIEVETKEGEGTTFIVKVPINF